MTAEKRDTLPEKGRPAVDVIIPVYGPGAQFFELLRRLKAQTLPPRKIILMNTEKSLWEQAEGDRHLSELGLADRTEVHHVTKREFDHGHTRNLGVGHSEAPCFVCMTQDALPADARLLEELTKPIFNGSAAMSYARQLPNQDADLIERYTRRFNYPAESCTKTWEDRDRLGIKTFFASNVCAAYSREVFDRLGGFTDRTIFNEDMIYACGLQKAGHAIRYAADARVLHSHHYTGLQQLKRNFDLAVSQAEHPEVFGGIKSESEGIKMVQKTAGFLLKQGLPGAALLPRLIFQSGMKYLGYRLGKRYRSLPGPAVRRLTGNLSYWDRVKQGDRENPGDQERNRPEQDNQKQDS